MSFSTKPREELNPQSFNLSDLDVSPPSVPSKLCGSSVAVAELRCSQSHEEHTYRSTLFSSRSIEQSHLSSIPEFQPLKHPLRQSLTSTVLNPTHTLHPANLKSRQKEERGWRLWELCSTGGPSEGDLTPHKENYWACAIPKNLPPSPDRHSAGWDPNKEYQALLDYTYPLRTNHLKYEWDSSERRKEADMQDSGIELENLCSLTSLTGLDFSRNKTGQTEKRSRDTMDCSLTDLQGVFRPSDCSPSDDPLFLKDHVSCYNLDCSKDKSEQSNFKRNNDHHLQCHEWPSSISTAQPSSTRIFHHPMCVCTEEDEELKSLPEQLNELQLLSTEVRVITAQLRQPLTGSWESLDPGTSSIFSSVTLPGKLEAKNKTREDNSQDDMGKGEWSATQTAAHMESLRSSGRWVEPVGGRFSPATLRKVEVLLKQLCDLTQHMSSQEEEEKSDSLLQHIKVFCSHLEQLIQYLYAVSEKMELLAQPAVDITRLNEYQREVKKHLPLTSCVMQSGQLLLSCINTMSPLLRDTLQLVERESKALQSYIEHFSIPSAMDNLVQPSPIQQSK